MGSSHSYVLVFPLFLLSLGYLNAKLIKISSICISIVTIIHCLLSINSADKSSVALAIIIVVLCTIVVIMIGKHLQLFSEEIAAQISDDAEEKKKQANKTLSIAHDIADSVKSAAEMHGVTNDKLQVSNSADARYC